MNDRKAKMLVVASAVFLLLMGVGMYAMFEKQGYGVKKGSTFVSYNIKDYIETTPVIYNDYSDVFTNINISKVNIKNIDSASTKAFIDKEEEFINYVKGYYSEIKSDIKEDYTPINSANSTIKTQINGTILSVFYEISFSLDENYFDNNIRNYIVTTNIDLGTGKVLSNEDLLSKYNYAKKYISEKLFEEDVLIPKGQVVIDKNTNISLTSSDIEKKKQEYVNRIIDEFDNIISIYIENNSLALVYDKKELSNLFFDNNFDTDIKVRYLK